MADKLILLSNITVKGITFGNRYACAPFDKAKATEDELVFNRKNKNKKIK